jgi:hypothetical protein
MGFKIIFKSNPNSGMKGPRFQNQDSIQSSLEKICSKWHKYLLEYVKETKKIFDKPEYPWKENERVLVSTLSASITRNFRSSLTIEELSVPKAANPEGRGRADLWASIPNLPERGETFSFYLEAKKSQKEHTLRGLGHFLESKYGFSKVLRDFRKNRREKMDQRSAYSKLPNRKHPHFVIGMLVTRLKSDKSDPTSQAYVKSVRDKLQCAVQKYAFANAKQSTNEKQTKRKLDRFPTVALIIPPSGAIPGMVATFTVFARTTTHSRPTSWPGELS